MDCLEERRMKQRMFGRTGRMVSEVGFGSWGIGGGQWTEVPDREALDALATALDLGVTFIDTADVYGDGRSEKLIAQALRGRSGSRPPVATKAGKRLPAQTTSGYTVENLHLASTTTRSLFRPREEEECRDSRARPPCERV